MNRKLLWVLCFNACVAASLPVSAFECSNSGTAAAFAPNDDGDEDATACGPSASAIGDESTTLGKSANSAGNWGTALGRLATSTGSASTAVGHFSRAVGNTSTAIGDWTEAAGLDSTALGTHATSAGNYSSALGQYATSAGQYSAAVGGAASSGGYAGTAVGATAKSPAQYSTALGAFAHAVNTGSNAIGSFAKVEKDYALVLGAIAGVNSSNFYSDVGIGTTFPGAPLHIFRNDSTQQFLLLQSNAAGSQDRGMIQLANNGGIRFQFDNNALGTQWRFQAATAGQDNFEISKVGTGKIEFKLDASGNGYFAGAVFESSDRNAKTGITAVDPEYILERVAQLQISHWAYKQAPDELHIGPMAQDFRAAFGTGTDDTTLASIDTSGVALASIQALYAQNLALKEELAALRETVLALKAGMDPRALASN